MKRPDDWVKKRNKYFESHQPPELRYKTRQLDYEAGADAIFEFAKEEGKRELLKEIAERTFVLRDGKLIRPEVK